MSRSRARNVLAASALVIAVAITASLIARSRLATSGPTASPAAEDLLEVQGVIDLGPVQNGDVVGVPIRILNRGTNDVVLDEFNANCACISLYTQHDGTKSKLKELRIESLSERTFFADIRVSGEPGLVGASVVEFRDSRPGQASYRMVRITFVPVASLYTFPRVLSFGSMAVGSTATQRFEVRSDGSFTGNLKTISMSDTDTFSMRYSDPDPRDRDRFDRSQPGQHLIGYIDVTLNPQAESRDISTDLVFRDGKVELFHMPASASIESDYALSPSTLILPRYVSGLAKYEAELLLTTRTPGDFKLEIGPSVGPMKSEIVGEIDRGRSLAKIRVSVEGDVPRDLARKFTLTYTVAGPNGVRKVILPVMVLPRAE